MKTLSTLLVVIFISCSALKAQVSVDDRENADQFFFLHEYNNALPVYLQSLTFDSLNPLLNYKIGICYLNSRSQKSKAVFYLEKAANAPDCPADALEQLGDAYHQSFDFDKAMLSYEKYKKMLDASDADDQKKMEEINWKIDMCRVGKALNGMAAAPISFKKGNNPKTTSPEFSSFLSPDQSTMTFTFQRDANKGKLNEDAKYFDELPETSVKNATEKKTAKVEKRNMNEATVATSVDGQIILNYRDEKGSASLYTTYLKGNSWTKPEKLCKAVNPAGWEENECISADGSTLYFTSNRAGGFGGKDLYACKKQSDGEWGKAVNLGPSVNTEFDEEAPFIHPDGVTLYFSSNGRRQIGHFDIFTSTLTADNNWSAPVTIGFPIDTTHDLVQEVITKDQTDASLQTKKKKGKSPDKVVEQENNLDNYAISFNNLNGAPLTLLKEKFTDANGNEVGQVKIIIRNNVTGEISNIYYSDSLSGGFALILPASRNNNITYKKENSLIRSENINVTGDTHYYQKRKSPEILPIAVGTKMPLNNIFFEPGKSLLSQASLPELNEVYAFLAQNPALTIEFTNTINTKEDLKINYRLSEERAEAIISYLAGKGIKKERITARGDAVKLKKSDPETAEQQVELKITGRLPEKTGLTTQ